jgi:Ser/Thr protein kinase RdoA (MazF antagonist)
MSFLAPEQYPVWKTQLLHGVVLPDVAAQVGALLAKLHAASANRPDLARKFNTLENFRALRIEPYFLSTAARHPDLGDRLRELADRTCGIALALVHGDVSPKNILVGPWGPVFLDAECAWYGDPAFDLAFCLSHLLLKSLIRPHAWTLLRESFEVLAEGYFSAIDFESRQALESRVAELLPVLMLARIDGKSPVEYLIGKRMEPDLIRSFVRMILKSPVADVAALAAAWCGPVRLLTATA